MSQSNYVYVGWLHDGKTRIAICVTDTLRQAKDLCEMRIDDIVAAVGRGTGAAPSSPIATVSSVSKRIR